MVALADDPHRVLVVDDDPRFGAAVTALLEAEGMVVVGRAEDGAAALLLLEALQPHVVTMDVDMPVMDGLQATMILRSRYPSIPVVLVTGSPSAERAHAVLQVGGVVHVPKATTAEVLPDVIRGLLA